MCFLNQVRLKNKKFLRFIFFIFTLVFNVCLLFLYCIVSWTALSKVQKTSITIYQVDVTVCFLLWQAPFISLKNYPKPLIIFLFFILLFHLVVYFLSYSWLVLLCRSSMTPSEWEMVTTFHSIDASFSLRANYY